MEVTSLDENSMKRMVLSIEKRINENMQMRTKYGDKPERFMDSELELYQELKRLHVLATAPELYPTFVRTRCVPSLLGLLAHEKGPARSCQSRLGVGRPTHRNDHGRFFRRPRYGPIIRVLSRSRYNRSSRFCLNKKAKS